MERRQIQRLAAASMGPDLFEALAAHGEDLLVERKVQLPSPEQLGAEVASMANMLGGWILLGVDDKTRRLESLDLPRGIDMQSHIGNLLRKAVDPVPPFLADTLEVGKAVVGYVRVFESSVPVLVTGAGALYIRDAGGKRPIDDHRVLLELAGRGKAAEEEAARRAHENGLTGQLLGLTGDGYAAANQLRSVVRGMPLTVTPQFADWPISRGAQDCSEIAGLLSNAESDVGIRPFGRAVTARFVSGASGFHSVEGEVVADCAGIVGAGTSQSVPNVVRPGELSRKYVRPLIDGVAELLERSEAFGNAIFDLNLICGRQVALQDQAGVYEGHELRRRTHCGSALLNIPADEGDRAQLAERWEREVAREAGIPLWEEPPEDE